MPKPRAKPVLGWVEWTRLPDLGVEAIRCKVDTGARTSALHADDLEEIATPEGVRVRFSVRCESSQEPCVVELPLHDRRPVRDSGGREELRPVILTTVELFGRAWETEISLTRRDDMEYNMLLGRRAIRGRFLVDPAKTHLGGDPSTGDTK